MKNILFAYGYPDSVDNKLREFFVKKKTEWMRARGYDPQILSYITQGTDLFGESKGVWIDIEEKDIKTLIKILPKATALVGISGKFFDSKTSARKSFESIGIESVFCKNPLKDDLIKSILHKTPPDQVTLELLRQRLPNDIYIAKSWLKTIADYSEIYGTCSSKEVFAVLPDLSENTDHAVLNSFLDKKLDNLLENIRIEPPSLGVLKAINKALLRMHKIKSLSKKGMNIQEIGQELGIPFFALKNEHARMSLWQFEQIEKALKNIIQAEINYKKSPEQFGIEKTLILILQDMA